MVPSVVPARHYRLTISPAFTNVTRLIRRVTAQRTRVRLVVSLAAATLDDHCDHPADRFEKRTSLHHE